MPPKKSTKSQKETKDKRNEISPLFEDTCTKNTSDKTGSTSSVKDTNQEAKRAKKNQKLNTNIQNQPAAANISPNYFIFDPSSLENMNDYSQPFPGQFLQSPPTHFQFNQPTQTPLWAADLMKDVQVIKEKVDKIDKIEKNCKFESVEKCQSWSKRSRT